MGSEHVRRSAARVQQIGDEVRRLADRTGAVGGLDWRSTAADGFRHRLLEEVARLRAVAAGVDAAADALWRHALAIEAGAAR